MAFSFFLKTFQKVSLPQQHVSRVTADSSRVMKSLLEFEPTKRPKLYDLINKEVWFKANIPSVS